MLLLFSLLIKLDSDETREIRALGKAEEILAQVLRVEGRLEVANKLLLCSAINLNEQLTIGLKQATSFVLISCIQIYYARPCWG